MRLPGKVAVVSGSGERMGKAVPLLFAQEGAKVVIGARTAERLDETVARIREAGGEAIAVPGNSRDPEYARRLMETAVQEFGELDILFNSVGGGFFAPPDLRSLTTTSLDTWRDTLENNLMSTFLCTQAAVPHLEARGGGVVINVAADFRIRQLGTLAYNTAKGGVISFTQGLARELSPKNIRVHCICPGTIRYTVPDGPVRPRTEGGLQRLGAPEDIAYAALYLASDESTWLTGMILNIDGGLDTQVVE